MPSIDDSSLLARKTWLFQAELVREAIREHGSALKAAEALGVHRNTISRLRDRCGTEGQRYLPRRRGVSR